MAKPLLRCAFLGIVGALVGLVLPMIVVAIYGLGAGLDEVLACGRMGLLKDRALRGMWTMSTLGSEWLWFGGCAGGAAAFLGSLWVEIVSKTTKIASRLLFATLLLAVGLVIVVCAIQNARDRLMVSRRYLEFCALMDEQDYEVAFGYLSPEYRETHIVQALVGIRKMGFGDCTLDPHHYIALEAEEATLLPDRMSFAEAYTGRVIWLEKVDGVWYLTGEAAISYD